MSERLKKVRNSFIVFINDFVDYRDNEVLKSNDPDGDTKSNFDDLSETLQKFLFEFPIAVSVYRKLNPGVDIDEKK